MGYSRWPSDRIIQLGFGKPSPPIPQRQWRFVEIVAMPPKYRSGKRVDERIFGGDLTFLRVVGSNSLLFPVFSIVRGANSLFRDAGNLLKGH
jgi:hypothetical protein